MQGREQRLKWVATWCLRAVLAGIFFYAGWVKVSDPTLFAFKVRNYELLPDPWVAVVALGLPWLEIFCALCIVSRRLERGALMLTVGMLLVFLFGLISAWARGLDIDCGCFSEALDRGSLAVAVATDVVLLIIAVRLLRTRVVNRRKGGGGRSQECVRIAIRACYSSPQQSAIENHHSSFNLIDDR